VSLERALPETVPVGSATAVFCFGVCYHPDAPVEGLEILVDGAHHRAAAFGMPRPDIAVAAGEAGAGRAYHSGFWATVPVSARAAPGSVAVQLTARLATGAVLTCPLGHIDVIAPMPTPTLHAQPARPGPELIAVCMATWEPDLALFETQVQSLRAQTDDRWICLISDDGSSPAHLEQIVRTIGDDPRFAISHSQTRLGFYRNFERALEMVPGEAALVALCDQDDRWHPDKLRVLRRSLGGAVLAYSDLRLVDAGGAVLRETLWRGRANNDANLASMLVANTITGAAMLFRRELMETALPFPDIPGLQFHDHWLALAALATGTLAYVDRPLYDYVQHPGAVFGDVTHGSRSARVGGPRGRLARLRIPGPACTWRAAYFYGYVSRALQAHVLLARSGTRLSAPKRRTLGRFTACDRSWRALAWLAVRPMRCLLGHTETLGSELELVRGIVWKRMTASLAHHGRPGVGPFADAGLPAPQSFSQRRLRRWRARL